MSFPRRSRVSLALFGALGLLTGILLWLEPGVDPPLRLGAVAPEFQLPVLQDVAVDPTLRGPGDDMGKVVFVNFWATWCPPCREEAPSLERLYQRLGGRGLLVLGVSIDEAGALEAVRGFRDALELTFPILLDPAQRTYRAYQATGVPETFVIGPDGRVVERIVGPRDWDHPRYASMVKRLLATGSGRPGGEV